MPSKKTPPKWTTTQSTYLVSDQWLKLRADTCVTPAGHEVTPFYVLEYGEWANCVVIGKNNEVTLLRHYRHGVKDYLLELVSGNVEPGETPEVAIRRELEEEIGLKDANIVPIGVSYPNAHSHTNKVHSFIAFGGTFDGNMQDEHGSLFYPVKMSLHELTRIIENHTETMQSMHVAAVFFALNYLKKHRNRR